MTGVPWVATDGEIPAMKADGGKFAGAGGVGVGVGVGETVGVGVGVTLLSGRYTLIHPTATTSARVVKIINNFFVIPPIY